MLAPQGCWDEGHPDFGRVGRHVRTEGARGCGIGG